MLDSLLKKSFDSWGLVGYRSVKFICLETKQDEMYIYILSGTV